MEQPTQRLVDDYVYDTSKVLGQGAVGLVYEGWKKGDENNVIAIKKQNFTLLIEHLGQKNYQQYIRREATIMKQVQNENIVHIYQIKLTKESFYIMMEYCNQGNLRQKLQKYPEKRIPEKEAVQIFKQIMNGYKAIFDASAIHRDLKPENILFKDNVVKIADFGLSKIINKNAALDIYTTNKGTPFYRPPQLLNDQHSVPVEYPQKIDIWSLGVLFYEMLVGKRPWLEVENCSSYLDEIENHDVGFPVHIPISKQTKDLILCMLTIDEKYRYSFEECMDHPFFKEETLEEKSQQEKQQ
ncbi:Protein kinase-like domain [Pseudocohnilembus persalinus]|uniref:Protein kinase-like domain n=1 Tax=Pseudocohnilembus persalinus TaxID=266149 RepID=A0A0V0Q9R8_PSEPJ|nr:Protein kinase-like domain [Pseudocohnilembus persalinus]|eukprot:KRW98895.1 Protein kinase-like domain [Pseudocohnilembus persalinus]